MPVLGQDDNQPQRGNAYSSRQYGEVRISGRSIVHQGDVNIYNQRYSPYDGFAESQDFHVKALYYASMNARKAQIHEAKEDTCDWIWSTDFAQWLASTDQKLFWIAGKPGSGKSTLMSFLEKAEAVNARLPLGDKRWRVISFFFDFRLAEKIGNNVEGLLRSLLLGILDGRPDIAMALGIQSPDSGAYSDITVGTLATMFGRGIAMTESRFLLLVDGLDEFEGNMKSLLETLTALRCHENLKLCLASRPEAMIQHFLGAFPSIRMSEHNWQGIRQYIHLSVEQFRPRLDALQLQDVQDVIHERAQGVFLWVYLAIEEVLQAWAAKATPTEVKARLNLIPTELRDLYSRILKRLPDDRRAEAAIIYTLVDKAYYPISTELLCGALHFLAQELQLEPLPPERIGLEDFELRLHATTGGLIEVSRSTNARNPSDTSLTVRLMHETVRSFTAESLWTEELCPRAFVLKFPDHVWARLCCEALLAGEKRIQAMPKHVPESWFISGMQEPEYDKLIAHQTFDLILQHRLPGDSLLSWTRLLWHSISFIIYHAHQDTEYDTAISELNLEQAMRTRWATAQLFLYRRRGDHIFGPTQEITDSDDRDLFIAGIHRAHNYLRTQQHRLSSFTDTLRGGLVAAMIMSSLSLDNVLSYISPRNYSHGLRSAVDMVLTLDDMIYSFHIAVYLYLGYRDVPEYLNKHMRAGRLPRQEPVQVPCWIPSRLVFPEELPLFIWACDAEEIPEKDCTHEKQLKVLTGFGADINAISSQGYNIVHYLITEHVFSHTFLIETTGCLPEDDFVSAIEKIYLVEKAGANFRTLCNGRTVLQALRDGVEHLGRTREEDLLYDLTEPAVARLAQLEFMLEHKAREGHLPHPLMGRNYRGNRNLPALKRNVEQRRCDMCTVIARRVGTNTQPSRIPRWAALQAKH